MTRLYFVTPAFRRFELTEVCFAQWQLVAAALAGHGVELRVVVIADDENLDIARAAGFDTLERDNDWLGRRFNDGIEYAGRHGADWIAPIGSDSWISPDYLWPLPGIRTSRRSHNLATVTLTRLAELYVTNVGAGPYIYHRSLLRPAGFRPARDHISKGVDISTMEGIELGRDRPIRWEYRDVDRLQHVSFRGTPHLTKYSRLWAAFGVKEFYRPWEMLAERYPADLVERARLALGGVPAEAVA